MKLIGVIKLADEVQIRVVQHKPPPKQLPTNNRSASCTANAANNSSSQPSTKKS